jgi:hypothetical protein
MSCARTTIAILSDHYTISAFGEAEWRAAFAKDPTGEKGLLIPVKVAPCTPPNILASRIYIDLIGKTAPACSWLPVAVPLPERILLAEVCVDGIGLTAVSYHAPPGVSWGLVKPRQAVAFASWLTAHAGPVVLGADANTPLIDAPDFADTRTHWHTGGRNLHGEQGDDLLFGPGRIHPLDDALRRWLADHPGDAERFAASAPLGPLAITHRTGRRKDSPGTGRRFDCIWLSHHWSVQRIDHLYDSGIAAGSDHAVVVADLVATTAGL